MASGYPIKINNIQILSSEALYQAMRFPNYPEIQKEIILQKSPMTAKMKSKKYREYTRSDWEDIKLIIMRWCLRVKLIQNWDKFGSLLLSTKGKDIVEESNKDSFWGAIPSDKYLLVGVNALGRLLMELRDELPQYLNSKELSVPNIIDFKLYGNSINAIDFNTNNLPKTIQKKSEIKYESFSLFD